MKTKIGSTPIPAHENCLHSVKENGVVKSKNAMERGKSQLTDENIKIAMEVSKPRCKVVNMEETVELRHKLIGRATQIHYPEFPLYIESGRGQYLYDHNGKQYLDLQNNVAHVGHCHPYVVKAAQDQMEVLNTNSRYLHDKILKCATMLTDMLPEKLAVCFFVNSGTEANDLAMRLTKTYTKHKDVVVLDHGYHGNSISTVDISPYKFNKPGGDGQQDYIHVLPQPDCYRGDHIGDVDDPAMGEVHANDGIKVIDAAIANGRKIGMFIAESMISCGGQMLIPAGYLKRIYKHIRKHGGLCVADEVQTGFGRAGKRGFWAFEMQDVVPDIVIIGKPFGNGHPVSCVVTTEEIAAAFEHTKVPFFNTFGGNPVSMVTAIAVMEVVKNEKLQENAEVVGEFCKRLLEEQKEKHELIGDIRGCGLFIGIDLVNDRVTKDPATEKAKILTLNLRHRGILISRDGPYDNVLKIKPPMVITCEDIGHFVEQLDIALTELEKESDNKGVMAS